MMNQCWFHARAGMAFLLALVSFSSLGMAFGETSGYVTSLDVRQDLVLVTLSNPPSGNRPACATSVTYAGVFPLNAAYAQEFYAALLTAQSRGTIVHIRGTDACTIAGAIEDIARITVDNQ